VHAEVHKYDVFARKTRVEPLHQVGSVVAPDDNLAIAYARATYDEERWVEMMIVPKAAIISLWAPGGDSSVSTRSSRAGRTTSSCSGGATRKGASPRPPGKTTLPRTPWAWRASPTVAS